MSFGVIDPRLSPESGKYGRLAGGRIASLALQAANVTVLPTSATQEKPECKAVISRGKGAPTDADAIERPAPSMLDPISRVAREPFESARMPLRDHSAGLHTRSLKVSPTLGVADGAVATMMMR